MSAGGACWLHVLFGEEGLGGEGRRRTAKPSSAVESNRVALSWGFCVFLTTSNTRTDLRSPPKSWGGQRTAKGFENRNVSSLGGAGTGHVGCSSSLCLSFYGLRVLRK